ncbi:hypothetical protein [Hydrogenophaga sp.]|uniref:hypothetical protein n=1 Tax=Hydrogenophaga sp. TaxID=1904254 RepID=UPI003F6BE69F
METWKGGLGWQRVGPCTKKSRAVDALVVPAQWRVLAQPQPDAAFKSPGAWMLLFLYAVVFIVILTNKNKLSFVTGVAFLLQLGWPQGRRRFGGWGGRNKVTADSALRCMFHPHAGGHHLSQ